MGGGRPVRSMDELVCDIRFICLGVRGAGLVFLECTAFDFNEMESQNICIAEGSYI